MKLPAVYKALAASLLLAASSLSLAIPIINQPPSTGSSSTAWRSDTSSNNPLASPDTPRQLSENFVLAQTAELFKITWYGIYIDAQGGRIGDDFFTVRVFDAPAPNWVADTDFLFSFTDSGPDAIQIQREDSGLRDRFSRIIWRYSTELELPLALLPGDYALSIFNDTRNDENFLWLWSSSTTSDAPGGPNAQTRTQDGEAWSQLAAPDGTNLALTMSVPEPTVASMLLLGLGLIHRKKQGQHGKI